MRGSKRRLGQQADLRGELAGDRMHLGHFDRFVEPKVREERREPTSEEGLSGSRWSVEKEIVATCGGQLQSSLGSVLRLHVAEVRQPGVWLNPFPGGLVRPG